MTLVKSLPHIERILLVLGLVLIAIFVFGHARSAIMSRAAIRQFQRGQDVKAEATADGTIGEISSKVDFSLWSDKRIQAYESTSGLGVEQPLAILRIARLGLVAPVLEGTGELILNRGVGHIESTSRPGEEGNIGIAGHRDGFFRVLKDIEEGDTIELEMPTHIDTYRVDTISLVSPKDISVLKPWTAQSVTLVTCYPFYFVGSAPQRYIIRASILRSTGRTSPQYERSVRGNSARSNSQLNHIKGSSAIRQNADVKEKIR